MTAVLRTATQTLWETSPAELLDRAVLETLAYADVFDYPISTAEAHRYLVGLPASAEDVGRAMEGLASNGDATMRGGWWMLPRREELAELRRDRAARARALWPVAWRYGERIGSLPFVRFVGVSGALAVDNTDADSDIDYFIVTESGRLWTARALVVALVRLARRRGHILCPNYLLSERAIALRERTLFTAHEVTQLVPIAGPDVYSRVRASNSWVLDFLPNAAGQPRNGQPRPCARGVLTMAGEIAGRSKPGRWLERWEQQRKLRRFARQAAPSREACFDVDCCKGHFRQHGQRVMSAYEAALKRLGEAPS